MLPCKGQCSEFQRHSPTLFTCVYRRKLSKAPLPLSKKKNRAPDNERRKGELHITLLLALIFLIVGHFVHYS